MHCTFEKELKWECIREIITLIRKGDLTRGDVLKITEHSACFIGCGAAMLRPEDEPIGLTSPPEDLQAMADALEDSIPTVNGPAKAVPWLQILTILLPLLLKLLEEKA